MQGRLIDEDLLSREDAFEVVQRQPTLQFPPGSRRLYNSSAYVILTTIAERIVGVSYPEWMNDHVFKPLGMESTTIERVPNEVMPGQPRAMSQRPTGFIPTNMMRDVLWSHGRLYDGR